MLILGIAWVLYDVLPAYRPIRQASAAEISYYTFPEEARDMSFEEFERELAAVTKSGNAFSEAKQLMLDRQLNYYKWRRDGVPEEQRKQEYIDGHC